MLIQSTAGIRLASNLTMGLICIHAAQSCSLKSIDQGFPRTKIRLRWRTTHVLLLLVLLMSVCLHSIEAVSFSSPVDCTHATSTCSSCVDVCVSNQYYPLLPSQCDPLSMVSPQTPFVSSQTIAVYIKQSTENPIITKGLYNSHASDMQYGLLCSPCVHVPVYRAVSWHPWECVFV